MICRSQNIFSQIRKVSIIKPPDCKIRGFYTKCFQITLPISAPKPFTVVVVVNKSSFPFKNLCL